MARRKRPTCSSFLGGRDGSIPTCPLAFAMSDLIRRPNNGLRAAHNRTSSPAFATDFGWGSPRGVAGKYKVQPINADSQSKADAAINEVERLISQEKVEIVLGVYASAHAVPLAAKVEAQKKILWITTAIATSVFKDQNRQYVFRAQIHSDQYGQAFAAVLAENAKARLA